MFVRGSGWVHVSERPCAPRCRRLAWVSALLHNARLCVRLLLCGGERRARLVRWSRSLRRRLRSVGRDPWVDLIPLCGDVEPHPGPVRGGGSARAALEVACVFHNVRGLACDEKRVAHLRSLRERFPVVALAETNCDAQREALWSKDWGAGHVFWSSGAPAAQAPGPAQPQPDGTFCRGVALFLSDQLLITDARSHCDGAGRLLLVELTLYREHKMLFIVSYAPSGVDADNRAFFETVHPFVVAHVPDHATRHVVWMGDHNNVVNASLDQHPPPALGGPQPPCRAGGAASSHAAAALGMRDAFRALRGDVREYTRVPRGAASRRLDRVLISSSLLSIGGVPRAAACWHIRSTDPLVAPRFKDASGTYVTRASDHGAVALRLVLSRHERAAPRWSLDVGIMLDTAVLEEMRAIVMQRKTELQHSAQVRMELIKSDVRAVADRIEAGRRARRDRERRLLQRIAYCDQRLGRGLRPCAHPITATVQAAVYERKRDEFATQLDELLEQRAEEWLACRGHEVHMDSRPTKAFFQQLEQADPERHMPIERVRDGNHLLDDVPSMVDSATRAFAKRFNQPYEASSPAVQQARTRLLHNVRKLPGSQSRKLESERILQSEHVLQAINQMPLHKTPGSDGFPAEFYRAFGTELAPLLTEMYTDCLAAGEMTPLMRTATVSLVYKKKGSRLSWKNYRPLSVSSAEYKILAKAMQLQLDDVLQYVIGPSQVGFQRGKYIGEATALAQLVAEYCRRRQSPGLMLLLDGEQAYDKVQWSWLQDCMREMGFPSSFRSLVALLYARPELQMKVNGVTGSPFQVRNGVKQGCPLSPLLYIISLQPLLDSLEARTPGLQGFGVQIPGPLGDAASPEEVRASGYADDVTIYLSGFARLLDLEPLMVDYHCAAGAATNWGKTLGLRLGALRGAMPTAAELDRMGALASIRWQDEGTDEVHAGCEVEVDGLPSRPDVNLQKGLVTQQLPSGWEVQIGDALHVFDTRNLRVLACRHLGIWLGGPHAVRAAWVQRVAGKMAERLNSLRATGLPASVYGRVVVQKVLFLGIAVFYATNQVPFGMRALVDGWSQDCWRLFWATTSEEERAAAGQHGGRAPSLVRHATAVQDHADGGVRAAHVGLFVEALRTMWVRRLLEPAPQPWKNILWALGFARVRPAARLLGEHLLTSADTLREFASGLPSPFREGLLTWGSMPTPIPLGEGRAALRQPAPPDPHYDAVIVQPLAFNSSAREPGYQPPPASEAHVAFRRTTDDSLRVRQQRTAAQLLSRDLVLVRDLAPYVHIAAQPDGSLHASLDEEAFRAAFPRFTPGVPICRSIVVAWPQAWLRALQRGPQPCSAGDWVAFHNDGRLVIGRVVNDQAVLNGRCVVREWTCDTMHVLHETGTYVPFAGQGLLRRCRCWWRQPPPPPHERANYVNAMTPRKHVPPPAWCYGGFLDEPGRADPTAWLVRGWPTLRAPRETVLAYVQNRDVYASLLSGLFTRAGDACAFPRAFEHGQQWHDLLDGTTDAAKLSEVARVFAAGRSEAMTRSQRQTVWQVKTCGLPVGTRNGGDGTCPIAQALGHNVAETHDQLAYSNPTAQLVWRHVLHAWRLLTGFTFATPREMRRAVLLGLTPQPLANLAEPFALLCAATLDCLVRHRHAVSLGLASAAPPAYSASCAAATVYESVRVAFQSALAGEHRRCQLLARQMRRAGLPPHSCHGPHGPMAGFRRRWLDTGMGAGGPHGVRQLLLPDLPPGQLALDGLAASRLAPCQELAPPAVLPPGCRQVYISSKPDGSGWAVCVVTGGDCVLDPHAALLLDATDRVAVVAAPGEDATVCALLDAVLAAMNRIQDAVPSVLRLPISHTSEQAVRLVSRTWDPRPSLYRERRRSLRESWTALCALKGGALYLAGYDPDRRHAWGERCAALAAGVGEAAPDHPDRACPVCLEDFSDVLPTPDQASRAPPGRWACPNANLLLRHALCRGCDADVQGRPRNRCPICRSDRVVTMHD